MDRQQEDRPQDQPPLFDILNAIEVDAGVMAYASSLGEAGWKQLLDIATERGKGKYAPGERARAVFLLGALRWRPAFTALRTLLHDESATVRLNAIHALGAVGGPHAVPPLLTIVKDPLVDLSARAHALRCLADIGDQHTLEELESWAKDEQHVELRWVAQVTTNRLRLILKGLRDPSG